MKKIILYILLLIPSLSIAQQRIVNGIINESNNKIGIGLTSPTYNFEVAGVGATGGIRSYLGYDVYPVPNPSIPTGIKTTGTELGIGYYNYLITYYTSTGETNSAISANITTTSGQQRIIVTIPVSTDSRVIGRKIYRNKVSTPYYNDYYLTTIANNTDVTITDSIPDASLTGISGASFFRTNTTSGYITINGVRSIMVDANATILGINAGTVITSGGRNSIFGYKAGRVLSTGTGNTYIGSEAANFATTGNGNTALGNYALYSLSTGSDNTALGMNAIFYNTTGINNTAIGSSALQGTTGNSTGSYNTSIGYGTGFKLTSGTNNLFLGMYSGQNITSGYQNVFAGYGSGFNTNSGGTNIFIGGNAGFSNTTASNNIFIGNAAGYSNTGSGNVYIGHRAGFNQNSSNKLIIANSETGTSLIRGVFPNDSLTVKATNILLSTARLKIGTTTLDSAVTATGGGHFTGGLKVDGDLTYNYTHGIMYFTGGTYTPSILSASVWYRILPTFTVFEADGLTLQGDTGILTKAGHYRVDLYETHTIASGKKTEIELFINNVALGHSVLSAEGSNNYVSSTWSWYINVSANTNICFKVRNTSDTASPTFNNIRVFINKVPE